MVIIFLLIGMIGRAAFPVLCKNLCDIGRSIRRGSIQMADVRQLQKKVSLRDMFGERRDSVQLETNGNPLFTMAAMQSQYGNSGNQDSSLSVL